ncbi:MAG: ABC transporter substrate-binding protein [Hydrogenophilales bacterium]|nr:ABC transporter substrate-binding protein [Hydrogenophilales bacterium]
MLKILHIITAALLLTASFGVRAETEPDVLARNTTNEVIRIVSADRDLKKGNNKKVYDLVQAKILPNFDFVQMTRLAVATSWNQATAAQQSALVEQFQALLVRTYAASISSVADYKIDYKPLRMKPGETDVTVNSEVSKPGAPAIPIDYRMEKQGKEWKVYDVLVDNVSLVTVYRRSFASEVKRGGIDGLIQTLAKRNQKNQAPEAKS